MKKISVVLVTSIIFLFVVFFSTSVFAVDMNIIDRARENETSSAEDLSLDATTTGNITSTSDNYPTATSYSRTTPTPTSTSQSVTVSTTNSQSSGVLTIDNILSILLLVVGFLLILLAIAILIRLKH